MCQNGTLESILDDPVAPPFPLRSPSVVPPYQPGDLDCAILAQFGVFGTLRSVWEADGEGGVSKEAI
jgi:hypothetical protein